MEQESIVKTMQIQEEVKGCPMCGTRPNIVFMEPASILGWWYVRCPKKCCWGKSFKSKAKAVANWNRRVQVDYGQLIHKNR